MDISSSSVLLPVLVFNAFDKSSKHSGTERMPFFSDKALRVFDRITDDHDISATDARVILQIPVFAKQLSVFFTILRALWPSDDQPWTCVPFLSL